MSIHIHERDSDRHMVEFSTLKIGDTFLVNIDGNNVLCSVIDAPTTIGTEFPYNAYAFSNSRCMQFQDDVRVTPVDIEIIYDVYKL